MILDEYALIPDIFDPAAYSKPDLIEAYLTFLKEPLLQESIVRDLCDGGWRRFCTENSAGLHRLSKEIIRKLAQGNRLRSFPSQLGTDPLNATGWCNEGLAESGIEPLTGIIAGHKTKQVFTQTEVASIEKLTGTSWWQSRSPSITIDRKTSEYERVLYRLLRQANSLMFIDPNLDPSSYGYREFGILLAPLRHRTVKPRIEIHRSLCDGDGPRRTFPDLATWRTRFEPLHLILDSHGLSAEVFGWDDFHDRYLITDILGSTTPAGFDVTGKPDDFSTWGRLGRDDKDKIQRLFDPAARGGSLRWRFVIGA